MSDDEVSIAQNVGQSEDESEHVGDGGNGLRPNDEAELPDPVVERGEDGSVLMSVDSGDEGISGEKKLIFGGNVFQLFFLCAHPVDRDELISVHKIHLTKLQKEST
jgi:hypothetical protein